MRISPPLKPAGGYASDLLSCVMAGARKNAIWVTLQSHVNIVAVAALLELAAVIITEGVAPDADTLAKAQEEGVVLLGTDSEELRSLRAPVGNGSETLGRLSRTLKTLRAEFHIHTVLSPCAGVEMIPPLIVSNALPTWASNLIAITDHNSTANVSAVQEAAQGTGVDGPARHGASDPRGGPLAVPVRYARPGGAFQSIVDASFSGARERSGALRRAIRGGCTPAAFIRHETNDAQHVRTST